MAYTTQAELEERFSTRMLISLTDRSDPPSGVIDASVVQQAITNAEAVIDGYLASRYALPMADVPPQIAKIALHLTIYDLHVYQADPKIEADYKDALRMLKDIQDGVLRLPIAGVTPRQTGESGVRTTDRDRPMTEDNLKGFI